jgi:DtxR family Mn-dependent transcriptional regulator
MTAPTAPLSHSAQDYLKTIYLLGERGDGPVSTSGLSEWLGLSASTVSGMLRKLTAHKLIDHEPYGDISLTDPGRTIALAVVRRHRLVEMFLVTHLAYRWDEVHQEAEILEHAVSDLLIQRIDTALGSPRFDPHGDPIPSVSGEVPIVDAKRMSALPPGSTGTLVRVDDHDPEVLQHLTQVGITLGEQIELLERLPFGGGQLVRAGVATHHFPPALAAALWVNPTDLDAAQT